MSKKSQKLLQNLGVPKNAIQNSSNAVICSTPSGTVAIPPDIDKMLQQLKAGICSGYEIYYIIISRMHGCNIVDFLLCPLNSPEYRNISADAKKGHALSFCWNRTSPFFSEPGDIEVKYSQNTGALVRTA